MRARPEYASGKKFLIQGEFVFVDCPESRVVPGESAYWYGKVVSGTRIYAYVDGNPISYTDPEGKFVVNGVAAVGGAVFGGVSAFWYTMMTTSCHDNIWATADWGAVLENTIFGAVGGAVTGATFGAATVGGAALAGGVMATGFGMNAGLVSNLVQGRKEGKECGCP